MLDSSHFIPCNHAQNLKFIECKLDKYNHILEIRSFVPNDHARCFEKNSLKFYRSTTKCLTVPILYLVTTLNIVNFIECKTRQV